MASKFGTWWQKIKQQPVRSAVVIAAGLLGIGLFVSFVGGYFFNWNWTGFGSYISPIKVDNFQRGKTLWDWMQLLLVPVMLAVGGFWLNQLQKGREERAVAQRDKAEQEAAEKYAQTEHEIASDNQRETTLQTYIDKISELLLMVRSFSERFWKFSTEAGHTNRTKSLTGIRCAVVRLTKE